MFMKGNSFLDRFEGEILDFKCLVWVYVFVQQVLPCELIICAISLIYEDTAKLIFLYLVGNEKDFRIQTFLFMN